VFFSLLDKKFNEDSKNVLKTFIFSLQVGFAGEFVPDSPFKLCSCSTNFDTAFLPDCTKFCSVLLRLLDRKLNEDSKNVLKLVIFSLQVGFTVDFLPDCTFKLCFCQFKI